MNKKRTHRFEVTRRYCSVQGTLWLCTFVFCFFSTTLLTTSCSSDDTIKDEHILDLREPMVFGLQNQSSSSSVETRAPLQDSNTNFKVNTWKKFGASGQTVVMDGYEVDYTSTPRTDAPDIYNWYYEGIGTQVLRYWDLGAFPYEFRAVSPFMAEATITDAGITVNKTFLAQSLINDSYNHSATESEPCVVAHVNRVKNSTDYEDTDLIKNAEINTVGKANATREVHMPFHHLNSKVGFRIFIDTPEPPYDGCNANIRSITITAQNTSGFITASTTYTATNAQGLGKGTFSNNTTQTTEFTLLQHGEYKDASNNDINLCDHLTHDNAYDLSPNCMQQIPQGNVKLKVNIEIDVDGMDHNYTRWLSLTDDPAGDNFTWEPDTRYIYYLHIKDLHGGLILFYTCEILPWDEVQTTDIDVGL